MKKTVTALHVWNSCFISAENPALFLSIAGASAVHTEPNEQMNIQIMFCNEFFNKLKYIFCFVLFSSLQKRKFSFMVPSWTYLTSAIS